MRAVLATPILLLLAFSLLTLALVGGFPAHLRIFDVLNNFAHAPVFGALAIVNFQILIRHSRLSSRSAYRLSFLTTLAMGVGIELIQPMLGRDGELGDVLTDALGAVAGLALVALLQPGGKRVSATVLALAMTVTAWPLLETALGYWERNRQSPAILEISSHFDWPFVWMHGFEPEGAALPVAWRQPKDPTSIRIRVERDPWRVMSLFEPIPDWHSYSRLLVDLTNPEKTPLKLTLRIHDREHNNEKNDRFNYDINIPPETRLLVEIPLADVETAPTARRMDLSRVAGVMIFASAAPDLAGRYFYVTRIWLEPEANQSKPTRGHLMTSCRNASDQTTRGRGVVAGVSGAR